MIIKALLTIILLLGIFAYYEYTILEYYSDTIKQLNNKCRTTEFESRWKERTNAPIIIDDDVNLTVGTHKLW